MVENCITSLKKRKGIFLGSYTQINYAIFTFFFFIVFVESEMIICAMP